MPPTPINLSRPLRGLGYHCDRRRDHRGLHRRSFCRGRAFSVTLLGKRPHRCRTIQPQLGWDPGKQGGILTRCYSWARRRRFWRDLAEANRTSISVYGRAALAYLAQKPAASCLATKTGCPIARANWRAIARCDGLPTGTRLFPTLATPQNRRVITPVGHARRSLGRRARTGRVSPPAEGVQIIENCAVRCTPEHCCGACLQGCITEQRPYPNLRRWFWRAVAWFGAVSNATTVFPMPQLSVPRGKRCSDS